MSRSRGEVLHVCAQIQRRGTACVCADPEERYCMCVRISRGEVLHTVKQSVCDVNSKRPESCNKLQNPYYFFIWCVYTHVCMCVPFLIQTDCPPAHHVAQDNLLS